MKIDTLFVTRLFDLCDSGKPIPGGIKVKLDTLWFTPKGITKHRLVGKTWVIHITLTAKNTKGFALFRWSDCSFEIENEDELKKDVALMRMFGWDELTF